MPDPEITVLEALHSTPARRYLSSRAQNPTTVGIAAYEVLRQ